MYHNHTVGVTLPAHNEANRVGKVIEVMSTCADRVYAIDDATSEVIAMDGGRSGGSDVVPVRHTLNRDAKGTLKTGYGLPERDGMDITVTIDADREMNPKEVTAHLDPIAKGRADYATGNRLAGGGVADEMPPFGLLGNRILTLLTGPADGYWRIRGPQNGGTAISFGALSAPDMAAIPDSQTAWRAVQPVAAEVSKTRHRAALLFLFGIVASLTALLVETEDEPEPGGVRE